MPFKDPVVARQRATLAARVRRKADRDVRWAQRAARIEARKTPPALDCAWAAGHFEGEGTISLRQSSGPERTTRIEVSLTSTDVDVAHFFAARWGGNLRTVHPKGNAKPAMVWYIGGSEAAEGLIRDLRPHLRTPRVIAKFDLALEDILDRMPHRWDEAAHARSKKRRLAMKALNHRGLAPPVETEAAS